LLRGLGICAVLDEPHDDLLVLHCRGNHQGRGSIELSLVDVCTTLLDEALHDIYVPLLSGYVQRCASHRFVLD
jgi:hypothetical protein